MMSYALLAATLACLTSHVSAANLLEDVIDPVPYYGPTSESSSADFPYSDFALSTMAPSASLYVPASATAAPYPLSSWVASIVPSGAPSGMPYSFGTAPLSSSWAPVNSTGGHPTGSGAWTHKTTPTSKYTPLVTQTSVATVAAPTTPASASPVVGEPNGAATLATSFAGLVLVAGVAILSL